MNRTSMCSSLRISFVLLVIISLFLSITVQGNMIQNNPQDAVQKGFDFRDEIRLEAVPGWPKIPDPPFFTGSAVHADIDQTYPGEEILVGYEKPPMPGDWTCYGIIYMWHADGTLVAGWSPKIIDTPIHLSSNIQCDDVDNDADIELVVATKNNTCSGLDGMIYVFKSDGNLEEGWPQSIGRDGGSTSSPVVADINKDGLKEIIVTSLNHNLYIFHTDGSSYLAGVWPKQLENILYYSPAVANLDNDPELEIVVGGGYKSATLHAFNSDGTPLNSNWPVQLETQYTAYVPTIQDVNNDQQPEILVGAGYHLGVSGKVYAFKTDGSQMGCTWPKDTDPYPFNIVVGDIKSEQPGLEILTAPRYSDKVYAWYASGTSIQGWPYANSSIEQIGLPPQIGDINDDQILEIVTSNICTGDPTGGKIIVLRPDGSEYLIYGFGKSLQMPLSLGDVDSDGRLEIMQPMIDFTNHNGPIGMWRCFNEQNPALSIAVDPGATLRVKAKIQNTGTATATNVTVTVKITGGFFHHVNVEKTMTFPVLNIDEEKTLSARIFFGLGPIQINVTASSDEGFNALPLDIKGTQLGIFTLVK